MNITDFLKNSQTVLFFRLLHEKWQEVLVLTKYIANGNRCNDQNKLHTDLAIRTHALEKGMSIGGVRVGFGQPKAIALLNDLQHYLSLGGEKVFVGESCSIINKYIIFNEQMGADMSNVKSKLYKLCETNDISLSDMGGIYVLDKHTTNLKSKDSFDVFSQSRFSVRDFGSERIPLDRIEKALALAEKTPSACNRQSWKIHVYSDDILRNRMFSLQGGCKGFSEDMQYAILICGDIRGYNINELSQVYVDGGIYAMNLLYALHFEDVAAIPLTMAHKQNMIKRIKREMGLPENEMPILLVGVGSYKESYKVAVSQRYNYKVYTVIK